MHMLVVNKTSVMLHHKKARYKNSMEERTGAFLNLELDMTLTSA